MKIALLADPHLSDVTETPQEEALDWAIRELKDIAPDACVWLGDLTACGAPDAALRFRRKISELPCPSLTVVGNSDLRTEATARMAARFFSVYPKGLFVGDLHIVGIDTSTDRILPEERERLSRLQTGNRILLCSHQPPKYLDADSAEFIRRWIADQAKNGKQVLLWASGHRHKFELGEWEGIPLVSVRALDLDKCIGGSAQICLWDPESGDIDERVYSRDIKEEWSEAERLELADSLGITCYNRTKVERDMPFAIRNRVPHLEWRSVAENDLPLLEQWRSAGGKTFSLHMSSLNYDNGVVGEAALLQAAQDAIRAGADMITVHPPQIPHEQMKNGSSAFDATADAMAEAFLPVVRAGIDIVVENNHTDHGTSKDPALLPYGCTPIDLVGWRDTLNERLGGSFCHLRLDVGHARNNVPLSEPYPIGKWYAAVGRDCYAYHLHQTLYLKELHRMKNHHPITGWHDGLIAFDGFLWAWRTRILRHGPVILEIREGEGAPASWQRLQSLLLNEP